MRGQKKVSRGYFLVETIKSTTYLLKKKGKIVFDELT